MALRDRQSKVVGIILKTSNLVSELLDSHCNIDKSSFEKKIFYTKINGACARTTLLRENNGGYPNIKASNPIFFLYFM